MDSSINNMVDEVATRLMRQVSIAKDKIGQTCRALLANGIRGANRHTPQLSRINISMIDRSRKQIELSDCMSETNVDKLTVIVKQLTDWKLGGYQNAEITHASSQEWSRFRSISLGGYRESLADDPMGFFIVTLDWEVGEIVVHHYWSDHSPAHVVRGRNGEAILLALFREVLITQKSHAAYLGAELAKAEIALRLGLEYEQDQPIRPAQNQIMHDTLGSFGSTS